MCFYVKALDRIWTWAHLSTGVNLANKEVDADVCDASKKRFTLLRILEQPSFGLLERLGPTALNHIREQGPRCSAKANKRDFTTKPMPGACDGCIYVAEFLVHIDVLAKTRDIRGGVERSGEEWCRVHENLHSHGLRYNEDVTEDYRRIDEAQIPPDWLEGDLARKRRRPADLKKLVLSPDSAELWLEISEQKANDGGSAHTREIATRLAHHPDWRTLGFFALRMTLDRGSKRQSLGGAPLAALRIKSFFIGGKPLPRGSSGFQSGDSTMDGTLWDHCDSKNSKDLRDRISYHYKKF